MITQLQQFRVEKPWGRERLPAPFNDPRKIGEIWFQNDQSDGANICDQLLVKYLFTSEKLSVQVHPDDKTAKAQGLESGKTECWYILHADEDARLGLGLKSACDTQTLRSAALSGDIEHMLDWKTTQAGDIWFVPPGTIHAIGGGLQLIEVQQNADITYRLYDYGRPRELHLDAAMPVATPAPYNMVNHIPAGQKPVLHSTHFSLQLIDGPEQYPENLPQDLILIPLDDSLVMDGIKLESGEVYYANNMHSLQSANPAKLLLAWPNATD